MKVVRNTCDQELSGEMKSAHESYLLQKFAWKIAKLILFSRKLCKIFRVKEYMCSLQLYYLAFITNFL